jgi:tetraacyldisaccharide 4'-kinase
MFDWGWLSSKSFPLVIITIGNLSTGGTGKTPMVEFIVKRLSSKKPGIVSRGYGRKTKGLILADSNSTAEQIGDEPYQIHQKFPLVPLALSEKRIEGIQALLHQDSKPDFLVLDDAFQHRYVNPSYQILLSTYSQPFFSDFILPAGNLRESRKGKKRANIIVITKCPNNLGIEQAQSIRKRVNPLPLQHVFFSTITYAEAINKKGDVLAENSLVYLISGIAKPLPFEEYSAQHFDVTASKRFPDHYDFTSKDIESIETKLKENPDLQILTTEKDWSRLQNKLNTAAIERVFHIPMEVQFLFDEEPQFLQLLNTHISEFSTS